MAGYLGMLTPSFLAEHTVLNVHYSLLPKYRGLHSVVWAMLNLEPEIGLTIHLANEHMDDGPLVYQYKIDYSGQTSWEIMQLFNMHIASELGGVFERWLAGQIEPVPQNKQLATWVPRRNLEDCLVDFSWNFARLQAFFKALVRPYPLPALLIRGQRFEIIKAHLEQRPYFCDLARVVNIDNEGAWIKCADSLLVVDRLRDTDGLEEPVSKILKTGQRLKFFRHD
jgi:methionyl-tRNA formyltransferase